MVVGVSGKRIILLGLVVFLFVGLGASKVTIAEDEDYPRHVNPSKTLEKNPPPDALFSIYSSAMNRMAAGDWESAREKFKLASRIYSTSELESLQSELNRSGVDLTSNLKKTFSNLENVEYYRSRMLLENALEEYGEAQFSLMKARNIVQNNTSLISELSDRMEAEVPSGLLENMNSLRKVLKKTSLAVENQGQQIKDDENLRETTLTLQLGRQRAEPGSELEVSGMLKASNDQPLARRTIKIYIGENKAGKVVTGLEGRYSSAVEVPHIYRERVQVHAVYLPSGDDEDVFDSSASDFVDLTISFQTPSIALDAPEYTYLGKNFTVEGSLLLDREGLSDFTVRLEWLGDNFETETGPEGNFSFDLSVPSHASLGPKRMEVESLPKRTIGPENLEKTVSITSISSEISFDDPGTLFLGSDLTITGEVKVEGGEVEGSTAVLELGDKTVSTKVSEGGKFKVGVDTSLLTFSDQRSYSVYIYPEKPWIEGSSGNGNVTFLNPLSIALVSFAFVSLLVFWWRSGETERAQHKEVKAAEEGPVEDVKGGGLEGIENLFVRAVRIVAESTGLNLKRNQTIREYLSEVKSKLGEAFKPFERLTLRFERRLYSDHEVEEDRSLLHKLRNYIGRSGD